MAGKTRKKKVIKLQFSPPWPDHLCQDENVSQVVIKLIHFGYLEVQIWYPHFIDGYSKIRITVLDCRKYGS